ncbi:MAG: hypothetical protein KJO07_00775 [Deltaproteobacteria bacterium]|nr:hypothetical protein [Deltaproteobacteria bacterium]
MATFTQRLTKTLRLDSLAKTLGFTATGCCPTCRLVQPVVYGECTAGCATKPRRIAAGDEEFFEPIPGSLQVIPENPQRLRRIRIGVGMVSYLIAGALLVRYVVLRGRLDLIPYAIATAATFPVAIAVFPKLKRKPPTVSNNLSGRPERLQLPAPSAPSVVGTAATLGKKVRRFLADGECIACQLQVLNSRGEVLIRARRSESFRVEGANDELTIVKGALDLAGRDEVRTREIPPALVKELGLKAVALQGSEWVERAIEVGTEVAIHGPRKRAHVNELAAYRDQLMDVVESKDGTLIEVLDRP